MEMVKGVNLKKYYVTDTYEVHALDGVSLSVEEGEFLAVVGTSGSGKTTLLNMLGGLDEPTEGGVWIRGSSLRDMSGEERTIFRRRNIGFVFQQYNLVPVLSVYENIVLPCVWTGGRLTETFWMRWLHFWESGKSFNACRRACQAVSSRGQPLPGRCLQNRRYCLPMSLPGIWIPSPVWK